MAGSFRDHGVELTDDDVRLFLQAAQDVWSSHYVLADSTHALLEALRARGLKLALVSNTASPGWLLEPILERQGITERVDTDRPLLGGRKAEAAPGDLRAGAAGSSTSPRARRSSSATASKPTSSAPRGSG